MFYVVAPSTEPTVKKNEWIHVDLVAEKNNQQQDGQYPINSSNNPMSTGADAQPISTEKQYPTRIFERGSIVLASGLSKHDPFAFLKVIVGNYSFVTV
jgi:hypothetical protein